MDISHNCIHCQLKSLYTLGQTKNKQTAQKYHSGHTSLANYDVKHFVNDCFMCTESAYSRYE